MNRYRTILSAQGGLTDEMQAVLAYADANAITKPSDANIRKIDRFIKKLKQAGYWARAKTFNIHGFGSRDFATINYVNPTLHRYTVTGNPTFTEGKGVKAPSSGNYFNTKYKVNEYSGIESDLTTVAFVYDNSISSIAQRMYGSYIIPTPTSTRYQLNGRTALNGVNGSVFSYHNNQFTFQNTNLRGLYVAAQDTGKAIIYKDGLKFSSNVTTVTPTLANEVLLLTSNISTTGGVTAETNFFPNNVLFLIRLDKFTDADEAGLRAICKEFTESISNNQTWYVRPTGATYGTGDGTSYANAFSGNAGIDWSVMGLWDTLYICDTHNERIDIKGNYMNIRGDHAGHPALLDGLGAIDTGMYIEGRSYLNIHNIEIANSNVEGMFFALSCNEIYVYDCDVHHIQNQAYQNELNSVVHYYRCKGHHCADDGLSLHSNATVYAYDCEFYNNVQGVNGIATTKFYGYNCYFHDNTEINIGPQTNADFTVTDCVFENGNQNGGSTIPLKIINCTYNGSLITSANPAAGNVVGNYLITP